MPEGHTLHRLALDLTDDLRGERVGASSPQGRFADAARLDGRVFRGARAVGKHLFLEIGRTRVHVHLGLFGKFKRRRAGESPRPSVRLRLSSPRATWDLTGPTACEILTARQLATLEARLGADPLATPTCPPQVIERIRRSARPIGALLLDQSILSGIGNVYRAELLFVLGMSPWLAGRDVPAEDIERLWSLAADLLARGVRANRIITVPPEERRGRSRARGEQLYVYKGHVCKRCGGSIARATLAARAIYYCPRCQPL